MENLENKFSHKFLWKFNFACKCIDYCDEIYIIIFQFGARSQHFRRERERERERKKIFLFRTFFTCCILTHGHCQIWLRLMEFSSVVLKCFRLLLLDIFVSHFHRGITYKIRNYPKPLFKAIPYSGSQVRKTIQYNTTLLSLCREICFL